MSETLWGDIGTLQGRLLQIEERLDVLAKTTPDDLIKSIEGLKCALTVAEGRIRKLGSIVGGQDGQAPKVPQEGWREVAHDLRDLMEGEIGAVMS